MACRQYMMDGGSLRSRLDAPLNRETMADEIERAITELGSALRNGNHKDAAHRFFHLRVMWGHYRIVTEK